MRARIANRWQGSASINQNGKEKGLLTADERAAAHGGPSQQDRRSVTMHAPDRLLCDNMVTTAKYSLFPLSFNFLIWKNLWEQFQKAANIYFLVIAILQVIPGLSPTGRYTTLIPLCVVIVFTMLKDAWEDWKRRVQDRVVNFRTTRVYRDGQWASIFWKDVRVGDVVLIQKGEPFPVDLVLLWSTEPHGMCYIETSSLDGETNLKLRQCPEVSYSTFCKQGYEEEVPKMGRMGGRVGCELPNNRLYNFDGYLELLESGKLQPRCALNADNVLLRGSELRNTKYALGLAVFTGEDTKLMRNMNSQHHKTSRVDSVTNRQIVYVFWFQILLAAICAIGYSIEIRARDAHWYLATFTIDVSHNSGLSFITFTILYNSFIPISLYIMLEVVKVIQAYMINSDIGMYHPDTNTAAMVRNSKLNEELGQVEYVFSDKTGTLTCNMMEFKKFSCAARDGDGNTVAMSYGETGPSPAHSPSSPGPALGFSASSFVDKRITNNNWQSQENKDEIRTFMEMLAVCHTVVPELDKTGRIQYQASSPDEACLVRAAQNFGLKLITRSESSVVIENNRGQRQTWTVLTTIEFTSARKRMSMVVKDPIGRLQVLVKGADNVILDMLKEEAKETDVYRDTLDLLAQYAGDGLRTLVFAKADISEEFFKRWKRKFDAANTEIHERQEKVDLVLQELEKDLDLVGTTAIEDKLQDGVPETIELLTKAGMKLWVLTGDKQETAINIGYSCNLLHNRMGLFTFDNCNQSNIRFALEKYILDVEAASVEAGQDIGLVIQGSVLQYILPHKDDMHANEEEADLFVSLAIRCKAVICCRVSPLQKAQLVEAVKERVTGVTLSIGDGANDVSMIQMAHVGVGISGLEGLQAARASDYSIAQFRFLKRLLLVHGRWNYLRISKLISFTFYKNMALYMTQFIFAFYNLFTGQSLYDSWALAFYNLAFTSFPIMALAVFDKDVEGIRLLSTDQFPELYQEGAKGKYFNSGQFLKYMFTAMIHSVFCFFLPAYAANELIDPESGRSLAMVGHAITAYSAILIVVTAKCGFEINTWTIGNFAVSFYSIYVWYLFLFLYASLFWVIPASDFAQWYGMDTPTLGSATSWLTVIAVVVVALLRDITYKFFTKHYNQELVHVVQEYESFDKPFNRFDVKKALPWLFPKQELKEFKPSLNEGVGRHRFAKDGGGGGGGDHNATAMILSTSAAGGGDHSPSPIRGGGAGGGSGAADQGSMSPYSPAAFDRGFSGSPNASRFNFSASFAASIGDAGDQSQSPGRRRMRITDIIEDEDYEMQPPIALQKEASVGSGEGSMHSSFRGASY